jgi:hypothetical protein
MCVWGGGGRERECQRVCESESACEREIVRVSEWESECVRERVCVSECV